MTGNRNVFARSPQATRQSQDILMVGVGGQGTVLASDILGDVALAMGLDVKKTDTLGMAQRGGSVTSHLRIGKKVWSPLISPKEADILLAFEKLEAARWVNYIKPDGIVIINNLAIPPLSISLGTQKYPDDKDIIKSFQQRTTRIHMLDGTKEAGVIGDVRTLNVFMLGFLSVLVPISIGHEVWQQGISRHLPERLLSMNMRAFERGREIAKMPVSDNVRKRMESGSWTRRMFEEAAVLKKKHGEHNVFDLSLGNPVIEPPAEFKQALRKLSEQPLAGMHRYMENAGYEETRKAVARQVSLENNLELSFGDIIMTVGAAGAINVILKTILEPGEEVIVFAPFFMEYDNYIDNHGGKTRICATGEDFLPDPAAFEQALNVKTRAVILNSPNNPTGVVYHEDLLKKLGDILTAKEKELGSRIYLISDEAYSSLIYDGLKYAPVFNLYHRSLIATSHSKDLALPGERIGYIAVHPALENKADLINGMIFCNRILGYVNAPALMQNIVRHLQHITVSIPEYQEKRDYLYNNLAGMGYKLVKPQGAFYMFPQSPLENDVDFVHELQKQNVLTVPGRGFGCPGYFRISYCVDHKTLEGALAGFKRVAEQFKLS